MKKITLSALSLFILFIIFGGYLLIKGNTQDEKISDTSNEFIQKWGKDEVVIGLDDAFPPIGFRDDNGELIGFDIELAKAAFEKIGVKPVFKPVEWSGVVMTLKNKEIDVVWNGMTITESREKEINFSDPYLRGINVFMFRKESNYKELGDLKGKVVGVQSGSSQAEVIAVKKSELGIKTIREYTDNSEAFLDLQNKGIDCLFIEELAGQYYVSNVAKINDKVSSFDPKWESSYTAVGIRKEDELLRGEINQALKALKSEGKLKEISMKWFGKDITL